MNIKDFGIVPNGSGYGVGFLRIKQRNIMSIEKLKKRLQGSIDFALDNEEDLDSANWNYQEGILITVNEAKLLLDLVKNCSIPDVVWRSEQLPCGHEQVELVKHAAKCKDCGTVFETKW